jgi:hypothetical protein
MLDITGASQVLFWIICVSYLFLNIQSITKLTKSKTQEYCMFKSFIKKKGQLGYKYNVLGRDLFYFLNKNTL